MSDKAERDVEKDYPVPEYVSKLRRWPTPLRRVRSLRSKLRASAFMSL